MSQSIAKMLRRQKAATQHASTQFDTAVADSTTSLLDLPSTYPFNSERYTRIEEGTVDETDFEDGASVDLTWRTRQEW